MRKKFSAVQVKIVFSLMLITPLGFFSKLYKGPCNSWVNDSLAGVFYEIFWCLFVYLFFTSRKPHNIAISVLCCTSLLELLQLWHPPVLENIRSTFLGRTLIGTSFSTTDFLYYIIGCFLGYLWLKNISFKNSNKCV